MNIMKKTREKTCSNSRNNFLFLNYAKTDPKPSLNLPPKKRKGSQTTQCPHSFDNRRGVANNE